jgi:hypothetical protein
MSIVRILLRMLAEQCCRCRALFVGLLERYCSALEDRCHRAQRGVFRVHGDLLGVVHEDASKKKTPSPQRGNHGI